MFEHTDHNAKEIAVFALNKMMRGKHFNICTIRDVADILNIRPSEPAFSKLRAMHCVDFDEMPPSIKNSIPRLIVECLGGEQPFQFYMPTSPIKDIVATVEQPKLPAWKRVLTLGK
jgi:hypothetical protein